MTGKYQAFNVMCTAVDKGDCIVVKTRGQTDFPMYELDTFELHIYDKVHLYTYPEIKELVK